MTIHPRIQEYIRFGATGVLNTVTDFAVLNTLLVVFAAWGEMQGALYVGAKSLSFLVAVVQSYFLNKFWVFRVRESTPQADAAGGFRRGRGRNMEETARFLTVSLAGLALNIATASLVFAALAAATLTDVRVRANIGAIVGTLVVLAWNYTGYKFFVFKAATKTL